MAGLIETLLYRPLLYGPQPCEDSHGAPNITNMIRLFAHDNLKPKSRTEIDVIENSGKNALQELQDSQRACLEKHVFQEPAHTGTPCEPCVAEHVSDTELG
ncbi:hypothetical protein DSL72_001904 [Monilinia vaccinii-corymbosi]|uniref:Uncharacterized protein n=1 Tax=Monilinia vaccinii-corymbosi TaxID=61207 RepID=A0A8A3PB48_9HELO|nr:hypothetical protein DSL72_001904 [Monilinia vaccinii-corymbosi]